MSLPGNPEIGQILSPDRVTITLHNGCHPIAVFCCPLAQLKRNPFHYEKHDPAISDAI